MVRSQPVPSNRINLFVGDECYVIVDGKIDGLIADYLPYEVLKAARKGVLDGIGIAYRRPDDNRQLITDLKLKLAILDEWIASQEPPVGS